MAGPTRLLKMRENEPKIPIVLVFTGAESSSDCLSNVLSYPLSSK